MINQAITRDQIELMRGQFHLWVHVIISMVADVKFETTCDWSNNIWGQNKWLWVHMLIHVI